MLSNAFKSINSSIDLKAFDNIYIRYNDNNQNEIIEYIKKLSTELIDYLDISKDISYEIAGSGENPFHYNVYITKDTLKIKDYLNDNETYEFSINN